MTPAYSPSSPSEISLRDVLGALWKGKLLIFACAVIGLLVSIGYLYMATEKWVSESTFVKPSAISLGAYMQKQTSYYRLGNLELTSSGLEDIQNNAFNTFLLTISSRDMQEKALAQTALYKKLTNGQDEQNKARTLDSLITQHLQAFTSDPAYPDEKRVSFAASTPQDAQETLKTFLEQANTQTVHILNANLNETIKNRVLLLQQLAESQKAASEQTRENRIALLKQARESAVQAKIDTSINNPEPERNSSTIIDFSNPETLFLLGEKNLSAQLQSLEQSPIIYPTSYYTNLHNARQLETLLDKPGTGTMYELTKAPISPLFRTSPKKGMSLVLGLLAGAFIGIFLVLLRYSVVHQDNRS